ncbi:hypothetical protein DFH07DRAFT_851884 [Mycena maculata]|uniref:FHA domain-containing protein n=1 Tax=Mycena maculata TaxID=230809 RepID=A0AAD7MPS1_9AGAR|nr:hypothetical protein DFH07DRAFT_851884 [Mycena maculata]
MNMEAGEIPESRAASPTPPDYDPSHEWPGEVFNDADSSDVYGSNAGPSSRPSLRLLVLRTSVLPAKQTLAITDGYTELQFGRDVAPSPDIPRIRLKEMEVSKLHATAFLGDNAAWHLVDMGSKHGTFLQPRSSTVAARLSPPRVASVPRQLHHLDTLAIGSTTFLVHIHAETAPCEDCCSTLQNEIPLFLSQKRKAAKVSSPDARYLPASAKKALTMLKQRLLAPSTAGPVRSETTSYTDRSARRRSLYTTSRLDAPGVAAPVHRAEPLASTSQLLPPPTRPPSESWNPPIPVTTSQPPAPLPATNVGHRLLLVQGWTPGSSLGISEGRDGDRIGLTAPLEVASTTRRAGLGMAKVTAAMSGDWREDGRQKRWQDSR